MTGAAWTFDEARTSCRAAAKAQEQGERELAESARALAVSEEQYRLTLAKRILEFRAEGHAATLCADLARGDQEVAKLRMRRDIADGVYKAMEHAAWRHNANRRDAQRFSDWSMRRELAEAAPGSEQPEWSKAA